MGIFGRCLLSLAWFWQSICPPPIRPARTSLDTLSVLRKHSPINCNSWCILKIFTFPWVRDSAIFRRYVWLRLVCTKSVWVTQSCPTLSDPTYSGPPGWPSVRGILQGRILWVSVPIPLQEWSGLPFPSPGDLPNPGMEVGSLAL